MSESTEKLANNWQTVEAEEELSEAPDAAPASSSRRYLIWLQSLAFLLGLSLLVYVINRVGVQPLFDALINTR